MKSVFVLWLLTAVCLLQPAMAQNNTRGTRAEKTEKAYRQVKKLVEGRQFEVLVNKVFPLEGFDVSRFNPEGRIVIDDTTARGHLPYFGRAYRLPYGEGGSIEFDDRIGDVEIKEISKRKNRMTISFRFTVRGFDDLYRIAVEAGPTGRCEIRMDSNNRPSISYGGEVVPLDKEEKNKKEKDGK